MSRVAAILAAALAVAAAGCGAAATPSHTTPGQGSGRHPSFKWMLDSTSAQPLGVAAENALGGTLDWRLPDGAPRRVEGYVSDQVVPAGGRERVFVRARSPFDVRVYRVGFYGGRGGRLVGETVAPLAPVRQPPCVHVARTGLTRCAWRASLDLALPAALPSGVYLVRLDARDGSQRDCLFVVQARTAGRLVVQIPTSTYEAYNDWGGDSLYPGGRRRVGVTGTDQGVTVSYDRPYASADGAGQFLVRDVAVVRFLERYGYPVTYTTDVGADRDPAVFAGARVLLDAGHSEYWSAPARRAFEAARDRGVNLVFLSSDTLAWRVRLADGGHTITGYKEHVSLDPGTPPTGAFPDKGAGLAGSAYVGCITPRAPVPGRAVYHYFGWSPGAAAPAWLLAGTGLSPASVVRGILGYELDQRTGASPRGVVVVGGGRAPCMAGGAAGSSAAGETTLYRAPSGAWVFASGTLGWEFGLSPVLAAGADTPRAPDQRLVRLTRNLLDRLLH